MIPVEAVEAAAKAWCGTIDLAGWQRRHIIKLLEAATPHIQAYLLAELRKAREALADAWDIGVMHGHNANGRLIDKRNENPYAAVAAAKETE